MSFFSYKDDLKEWLINDRISSIILILVPKNTSYEKIIHYRHRIFSDNVKKTKQNMTPQRNLNFAPRGAEQLLTE